MVFELQSANFQLSVTNFAGLNDTKLELGNFIQFQIKMFYFSTLEPKQALDLGLSRTTMENKTRLFFIKNYSRNFPFNCQDCQYFENQILATLCTW